MLFCIQKENSEDTKGVIRNCKLKKDNTVIVSHMIITNARENRRDNQEWTIQRNWQHWVHKTQDKDKQNNKHNIENYTNQQHGPTKHRG